jgi:type IV secretory pathway TrbD component
MTDSILYALFGLSIWCVAIALTEYVTKQRQSRAANRRLIQSFKEAIRQARAKESGKE